MHVLDIVENSVAAGATRVGISIQEDMDAGKLTMEIEDNGQGMSADMLKKVSSPSFRRGQPGRSAWVCLFWNSQLKPQEAILTLTRSRGAAR